MSKIVRILLISLCFGVPLAATSPAVFAKKKAKSQRVAKPKQEGGSAESAKDRERRLLRECRGRPNAGACEGFTRGK
jgi:hypothetical protein